MSSSTTSVRRIKERSGSGGRVMAPNPSSKTLDQNTPDTNRKPTGKENTRSLSATRTHKPFIKPVPIPRIDKPASQVKDGESRGGAGVRRSTSSVPRGRSSSPSDFARLLSDRMSRVSVSDQSAKGRLGSGVRVLERSQSQKGNRVSKTKLDDGSENGVVLLGHPKYKGLGLLNSGRNVEKQVIKDPCLKSVEAHVNGVKSLSKHAKLGESIGNVPLKSSNDKRYLDLKLRVTGERTISSGSDSESCKKRDLLGLDSKVGGGEPVHAEASKLDAILKGVKVNTSAAVKVADNIKEKVSGEEAKGVRAGTNKYSSKLHEKLAFLEGKVKRIASDIKKTKEMLDMNNPDSSKTIISDIQDKISGIEKAMGHMVTDNKESLDAPKIVENTSQNVEVGQKKHSVKDLSHEELEARLFPHHKLLRGRVSLPVSSTSTQNDLPLQPEPSGQLKLEDTVLSPEENSIALEFLDSLNRKESKVCTRNVISSLEFNEVQEMEGPTTSTEKENLNTLTVGNSDGDIRLTSDELIEEFDDEQENIPEMVIEDVEESCVDQLHDIGRKTSTGGWFVSEGESVLLAHDDGSCTFYDITNSEVKAEYKPPAGVSPNLWGDCWLIRAPDSDGCSGRYVVAASSGSTLDSGFCAWDFYTKDVRSFHVESETATSSLRTVLGPLPNTGAHKRSSLSTIMSSEDQQWWYKPCGHLIVSTASSQRGVSIYDVRDGEQIIKWETQRPVISLDYSSPMHWRNRGKVVIAEGEAITLWDVNSLTPQALLSVALSGRKVSALHVNNTDAEIGGGVRRRVSSSDAEGQDGVFCTQDSINVMDFRLPSGVGLKISNLGVSVQSVFSRADSIFLGCASARSAIKEQGRSCIQQFSLRKGRLVSTYALPESTAHFHCSAISQVWGNSDYVMGICGLGLFVFDASNDEETPSIALGKGKYHDVRDIIGPADLYAPSFDYLTSRVLVISRDRPAMWRYLS